MSSFTATSLKEFANKTFAGYCYPHAPKTAGSMVMVVTKPSDATHQPKTNPFNQLTAAIKEHNAKNVTKSPLFESLMQCSEKAALLQPLNIAVSGVNEPGLYCIENFVCPTHLYHAIGTAVFQALLTRIKPQIVESKSGGACKSFNELETLVVSSKNEYMERSLGAVLYAQTLLHTSAADSGMRFKDRSALKIAMASRNKTLWEFARQLKPHLKDC